MATSIRIARRRRRRVHVARILGVSPATSRAWVLAVAAVLTPVAASGDTVFKWRGSDGEITYSFDAPPGVAAERFELREVVPPAPAQSDEPTMLERLRAEAADRVRENCEIAKQNIKTLKSFERIEEVDASGEPRALDEEEVRARFRRDVANIEKYCKE